MRAPPAVLCLLGVLVACRSGGRVEGKAGHSPSELETEDSGDSAVDPAPEAVPWPFSPDELIEVEIALDPTDWETLRLQSRSIFEVLGGDCLDGPFESPYTEFPGTVLVNGEEHSGVGVRKKGFIGSLDVEKPGLRLDFDEYNDGGRLRGREDLTLNNTPQDPTMLRTCLAYQYFAAAGVPASGCAFAHVVVNGEDLGLYANVEPVDEALVERVTGAADAPLFEGTLSDLRPGWTQTFEADSDAADLGQLDAAVAALDAGDLDALATLIDLEDFVRFWAAEVVLGHWDGYNWNRNNYYLYIDPADGLLRFLPWGTDAVLSSANPGGGRDWIAVNGALGLALAKDPTWRAAYEAELDRQLTLVWDAEAVAAQAEAWVDQLSEVHRFPRWARNDLTERIEQAAPTIAASRARERGDYPDEAGGSLCIEPIGSISVDLRSTWGSWSDSDWTDEGDCTLDLVYDGDPTLLTGGSGVSGDDGDSLADMGCYWSIDGAQLLPYFGTPFRSFGPGVIQTDNTTHYGILYYAPASGDWRSIGWLDGALELDEAEATVGAAVNGHFSGTVWQAAW
jgi:spore coat protein CotH